MKTLTDRLHIRIGVFDHSEAISFDARRDVNYFETVRMNCPDHLDNIDIDDLENCADILQNFAYEACNTAYDTGTYLVSFYIDKI